MEVIPNMLLCATSKGSGAVHFYIGFIPLGLENKLTMQI